MHSCALWAVMCPTGADCGTHSACKTARRLMRLTCALQRRCVPQVLIDHGVEEHKILFLCIMAAPDGIHKVCLCVWLYAVLSPGGFGTWQGAQGSFCPCTCLPAWPLLTAVPWVSSSKQRQLALLPHCKL